jgi:hypothetical protein
LPQEKTVKAAVLRALALAALAALPAQAQSPAAQHPKASSLAPHAHSRRHVYGAPIQRPVVSGHTRHKRREAKLPS